MGKRIILHLKFRSGGGCTCSQRIPFALSNLTANSIQSTATRRLQRVGHIKVQSSRRVAHLAVVPPRPDPSDWIRRTGTGEAARRERPRESGRLRAGISCSTTGGQIQTTRAPSHHEPEEPWTGFRRAAAMVLSVDDEQTSVFGWVFLFLPRRALANY